MEEQYKMLVVLMIALLVATAASSSRAGRMEVHNESVPSTTFTITDRPLPQQRNYNFAFGTQQVKWQSPTWEELVRQWCLPWHPIIPIDPPIDPIIPPLPPHPSPVPLPAAVYLFGTAVLGLVACARRRVKRA